MAVITENHLEHFYVPFSRVNEEEQTVEAYCYVNNKVKSDRWDMPREVLERSAELYMQMPAVREMHGNSAAGKATRLDWDAKGCKMTLKVVDPVAWQKVKENVYRGLSIGGRPELVRGNQIQKFDWVETSLVDRPADPDCKFTVVRLDDVKTYDIEVIEESTEESTEESMERVLESGDVPVRQNLEGKPVKASKMPTCSDEDLIAAVGEVCFAPEQQEEIARGQSSRAKMKQGRARAKAQDKGGGKFDDSKHPRGNPKNKGQFGKGGGGSKDAPDDSTEEDKSPVPDDSQADEQELPGDGNEEPDMANPDEPQAPDAPDGIPPEFHTTKVNTDQIAQVADKLSMPDEDKGELIQAQKEGKIQTAADLHGAVTDIRDNNGGNTDPAGANPVDLDNVDEQPDVDEQSDENAPQVGDDQDDNPDGVQPDNTDPDNPEPTPEPTDEDPNDPGNAAAQEDTNSDTGDDTEDDNTAPVDDQDTAGTDADGDSEQDTEQDTEQDKDPDPDPDNSNTSDKVKQMKQHLAQMSVNLKSSILKSLNFALDNASETIDKMVESYRDGSNKGSQYAGIGRADVTSPEQKEELMGVLQRVCQAQADKLNAEVDAILGAVTLEDFTAGEAEEKPVKRSTHIWEPGLGSNEDEGEKVPDKSEAYLQRIEALEDQMNKMSNVSLKRPFARADATAAEKVFGLNEGVSFGRASSSIDRDTLKKTKEAFVERAAAATTQDERTFCAFEITKIDSILGSIS